MSMESDIKSRHRVVAHQTHLRRSNRFISPEKLKLQISSQKSTLCRKSVKFHLGSPSITSKSKEATSSRKTRAAISGKSQLKLSRSKSGVVLEETQSGPRRSPRLASQTGMKVSEIQEFPDGNPRRQSMRLLGITPIFAENVKAGIENPSDEVEHKNPLEVDCKVVATRRSMGLVSVNTKAAKEWNEPEAIAMPYSEIVPKKTYKPMSSQIRRSSPRLTSSTGVIKRGVTLEMTDKGVEIAERLNANRGDLVLESKIEDDFGKSQLKLLSGVVLEETQSGPRRSLRLASQTGIKVSEIQQEFPDGNPRRQSMRLLRVTSISAENVKTGIENPSDEVEHKNPLEEDCKVVATRRSMGLVSVNTKAAKEWNEPEAIAMPYSEIVPKNTCKPMSSPIRRSSPRLTASTGVIKRGVTLEMTDKGVEIAERLNANKGDLVLESKIEDHFVIMKADELHKTKRRKMEEDNGVEHKIENVENEECCRKVAWTNEQEEALRNAYLVAKPSPHFWKKVSRMVPEKSAQECFDKIHASILTPLSPQPRPRTRKKSLSPIPHFNLSANILSQVSEMEAGRLRRCRTKKRASQKTVRHLLRKHRLADQTKAADHFSLLESSPINTAANVLNDISNSPSLSQQPAEKSSANSKMFSRFKLLTSSPEDPSPQVLKRIKNRALHDRYIDQLHTREARRMVLAKKSKFNDSGNGKCFGKPEHGGLKAVRTALMSDAKAFINHYQHTIIANPMDELDTDCGDDADGDIDVSDLDE